MNMEWLPFFLSEFSSDMLTSCTMCFGSTNGEGNVEEKSKECALGMMYTAELYNLFLYIRNFIVF